VDLAVTAELKELRQVKRLYEPLQLKHDLLKKSHRVHFGSKGDIFAFIEHHQETHPVGTMCPVLGVSASGHYSWDSRPASQHAIDDAVLVERFAWSVATSCQTYDSPRVHTALRRPDEQVSRAPGRATHAGRRHQCLFHRPLPPPPRLGALPGERRESRTR
jgi:hypothetical protein